MEEYFVCKRSKITFKRIKKGDFLRGSNKHELCERPQHEACISKDFYLGIYPVTQDQWLSIAEKNPSFHKGENLPVEKINWRDAIKFCEKLTEKEKENLPKGYLFRLPTEAEWEYACLAGKKKYTEEEVDKIAWFIKNSDFCSQEVGLKNPNDWGLFDMLGNVFEWVQDACDYHEVAWYKNKRNILSPSYKDKVKDPCEIKGSNRIAKGGCWFLTKKYCRPSFRYINSSDSKYFNLGFRVALAKKIPLHSEQK